MRCRGSVHPFFLSALSLCPCCSYQQLPDPSPASLLLGRTLGDPRPPFSPFLLPSPAPSSALSPSLWLTLRKAAYGQGQWSLGRDHFVFQSQHTSGQKNGGEKEVSSNPRAASCESLLQGHKSPSISGEVIRWAVGWGGVPWRVSEAPVQESGRYKGHNLPPAGCLQVLAMSSWILTVSSSQ